MGETMVAISKLVLDVLKPHQPNALEFATKIAEDCNNCKVYLDVIGVDENTESVQITIEGDSLDFSIIQNTINSMGGSLHSIDKVWVLGDNIQNKGSIEEKE